ncbi:Lar family restriction alleviation protein [Sphingopyxis flava]
MRELTVGQPAPPPKPPQRSAWQRKGPLVQLEPCPFCGGEAEVYSVAGSYGYYASKTGVRCTDEHCHVRPWVAFDDEEYDWNVRKHVAVNSLEKAVQAWNTRIPLNKIPNTRST